MVIGDLATSRRGRTGQRGEEAVRERVTTWGWRVVDHNVRWREGELDLIALDRSTLVFGEVKTLVGRGPDARSPFSPFESIDLRKQMQIRRLARRWLADELRRTETRGGRFSQIRFDAFAVTLDAAGAIREIEHLEDAF